MVITAPIRNRMGLARARVGSNPTLSGCIAGGKKFKFFIFATIFFISTTTFAAAFQLWEESAASLGDYHAGGAAEANDASSIFYNPAGMMRLKHQELSAGVVYIPLDVTYHGNIVSTVFGTTTTPPNGVSGETENVVPNFHYVLPINQRVAFGFEETTPFGLSTNYANINNVGLLATKTDLRTFNLNPSVAFEVNRYLSLGAGFDAMYGEAIYDDAFQFFGSLTNSLKGWGYGYNAGGLWQFDPKTRLGLSYRSAITLDLKGLSDMENISTTVSAQFPLPATTTLSFYRDVSNRWAMMTSVFYTEWSSFRKLMMHNISQGTFGPASISLFENYRNTWNFSVGSRYRLNHFISLEAGVGHDETPTRIPYRDIRLPDASRFAASFGVNMHPMKDIIVNAGWTHFFVGRTNVDNTGSNAGSTTEFPPATGVGYVDSQVNVFGLQLTWII